DSAIAARSGVVMGSRAGPKRTQYQSFHTRPRDNARTRTGRPKTHRRITPMDSLQHAMLSFPPADTTADIPETGHAAAVVAQLACESLSKNLVNAAEYPQTEAIHQRVIQMIARLFHANVPSLKPSPATPRRFLSAPLMPGIHPPKGIASVGS